MSALMLGSAHCACRSPALALIALPPLHPPFSRPCARRSPALALAVARVILIRVAATAAGVGDVVVVTGACW